MRRLTFLLTLLLASVGHTEEIALDQLEAVLERSPEVEIAAAELEESLYLLQRERERRGLKLFATAGYADVTEPITDELKRSYRRTSATIGLSYPLFGTRAREEALVAEAESSVYQRNEQRQLATMRARAALRRNYVEYWAAGQRVDITLRFLENEPETRDWLLHRTQTGHLLEADRLEFLTAFDLGRRALASDREIRHRALRVLSMLTTREPVDFVAADPRLPNACLDPARLRAAVLADHPELNVLRSRMDTRLALVDVHDDIEATLNVTATRTEDHPSALSGDGLGVSFNVRMPLDFMGARRAGRNARSAAALRAQRELELRSAELANEASAAVRRYAIAVENLTFAETRLAAGIEAVRERQLRAAELPGDVLEQLQQARFSAYRTAMDLSDAEAQLLKSKIEVLAYSESACAELDQPRIEPDRSRPALRTVGNPDPPPTPQQTPAPRGVYLWDSRDVLGNDLARLGLWDGLRARGLSRVLISLDGEQIDALRRPFHAALLAGFIEDAQAREIEVELLLGEPTWMLSSHRQEMLDVIARLERFRFDGLHLDLEPGMIDPDDVPRAEVLAQLAHTVGATLEASPWPVSLSMHFRDLDPDQGYCLGCVLSDLPIREVTLMIYVSNPVRVAEIANKVAARYPRLMFSVAQSIEPELPLEESHAHRGARELDRRLARLDALLDRSQFNGIVVQSWSNWEDLKP